MPERTDKGKKAKPARKGKAPAKPKSGRSSASASKRTSASNGAGKAPDVYMHLKALAVVLRHGLRFANASAQDHRWVECMGFLLGDIEKDVTHVKDAIPITNGNKVEVRFTEMHYKIADEINAQMSEDNWVVGWYHTHPGHDLFLSTVDRVNHAGYQMLNPKALALVFDPSKLNEKNAPHLSEYMKFFTLKDPEALERSEYDELGNVQLEGSFSDLVDAIRDIAELSENNAPIIAEYKEQVEGMALEEVVMQTYKTLKELKVEMRDLQEREERLEKEVRSALENLVDDEALE